MSVRLLSALGLFVLLGAGCWASNEPENFGNNGQAQAAGDGMEVCLRTDGEASGNVRVFAANVTAERKNDSQWFTDKLVAEGEAGNETCGRLGFDVQAGDELKMNGDWSGGARWLVENKGKDGAGSDHIRELWINDQYYAVGKECRYESNGAKGFDLTCMIR